MTGAQRAATRLAGGEVAVWIGHEGVDPLPRVDDSSAGTAETRASARWSPSRGLSHVASGSGSGPSIVQRVAERHGGTLLLDTAPLGGLRAEVRLPTTPRGRE